MNDDFESRLAELLNESVDAQLGTTRVAVPPFSMPSDSTVARQSDELAARRRRRLTFFAVAATVIAVVAAALALNEFVPSGRHTPPATHAPAPKFTSVRVGGASIALPPGWVVRSYDRYGGSLLKTTWCLTPASTRASKASIYSCPIEFIEFSGSADATMDPDATNGLQGDQPQTLGTCVPDTGRSFTESASLATFGGREAEARRFALTCPDSPSRSRVEREYSVVTPVGYILLAYRTPRPVAHALDITLTYSHLPPQTSSLRLADTGRVLSVHRTPSDLVVTIRRITAFESSSTARPLYEGNARARYVVPRGLASKDGSSGVKTGDTVFLRTDGVKVTNFNSY